MDVFLGGMKIRPGEQFSWEEAQEELDIEPKMTDNQKYALLMFDAARKMKSVADHSDLTHYLVINLSNTSDGDVLVEYAPPNPPDYQHQYIIELFKMDRILPRKSLTRQNAKAFVDSLNLSITSSFSFYVSPMSETKMTTAADQPKRADPPKINDQQRRYCHCLKEVGEKGTAYNVYAVCAHSVGTTTRNCEEVYKEEEQ